MKFEDLPEIQFSLTLSIYRDGCLLSTLPWPLALLFGTLTCLLSNSLTGTCPRTLSSITSPKKEYCTGIFFFLLQPLLFYISIIPIVLLAKWFISIPFFQILALLYWSMFKILKINFIIISNLFIQHISNFPASSPTWSSVSVDIITVILVTSAHIYGFFLVLSNQISYNWLPLHHVFPFPPSSPFSRLLPLS